MKLTIPQADLLAEIRECGGLYITRYRRYHRTAQALVAKGLIVIDQHDYSTMGQDHYVAVDGEVSYREAANR